MKRDPENCPASRPPRRRGGIRLRVFVATAAIVCISAIVVAVCAYAVSAGVLRERVTETSVSTVAHMGYVLHRDLSQLEQLMAHLFTDETLHKAMQMDASTPYNRLLQHKALYDCIQRYSILTPFPYLNAIIVYNTQGDSQLIYLYDLNTSMYLERSERLGWVEKALAKGGGIFWPGCQVIRELPGGQAQKDISMLRAIKGNGFRDVLGVLQVSVSPAYFTMLQDGSAVFPGGHVALLDPSGTPLSGEDAYQAELSLLAEAGELRGGCTVAMDRGNLLIAYQDEGFGYTLLCVLPTGMLTRDNARVILLTLLAVLLAIIVSAAITFRLSGSITGPIVTLTRSMARVRADELDQRLPVTGTGEVAELSETFNRMLERIRALVVEVREKQASISRAEFRAVLAQVNPHFLYNSLSAIRLMAIMSRADNITRMVDALWRILKSSTTKVGDRVRVRDELSLVEAYVALSQMLDRDKFDVVYHVDEAAQDLACPKFFIQPLVENAIQHGIRPREGFGLVTVSVTVADALLRVSVRDNGVGMTEEKLSEVRASLFSKEEELSAIGLRSVQLRIRALFGDEYGLTLESRAGEFTEVSFTLPALESKQAEPIGEIP